MLCFSSIHSLIYPTTYLSLFPSFLPYYVHSLFVTLITSFFLHSSNPSLFPVFYLFSFIVLSSFLLSFLVSFIPCLFRSFLPSFLHSSFTSFLISFLTFFFPSFIFSFIPSIIPTILLLFLFSFLLLLFLLLSFLQTFFPVCLHFFRPPFFFPFFLPSFLLTNFYLSILNISKYHTYMPANIWKFNLQPSIFQSVHSYTHYYVFLPFFKLTSKNVQIYKLQPSKQSRYIFNRPFLRPYIHIIISHPSIHPPSLLHIIQNST